MIKYYQIIGAGTIVEIYEYLWDIMQLENSNIWQLYEKTGISKIKLIHFFKSDYKKGSDTTEAIAAANRFIESRNSDHGAYRRVLPQQAARNPRFRQRIHSSNIIALCPAPEQRYLRIIARGIADAYQSNKTK